MLFNQRSSYHAAKASTTLERRTEIALRDESTSIHWSSACCRLQHSRPVLQPSSWSPRSATVSNRLRGLSFGLRTVASARSNDKRSWRVQLYIIGTFKSISVLSPCDERLIEEVRRSSTAIRQLCFGPRALWRSPDDRGALSAHDRAIFFNDFTLGKMPISCSRRVPAALNRCK